jgi:predicted transcriptional regulator
MRDGSENIYEILFVCRDITHKKERHSKLLFSQSYLISEATSETAVEIFAGMLRTGNPGLYIGRTSDSKIKNIFTDVTPTIVKLSKEKDKKHLTCSNFEELLPIIEEYVSKEKQSIVLLDRIEYLIINSSFESMIKNIYRLNDMMEKHNCLLLLRINPSLLDKTQMTILKEELQGIPEQQIDDVQLEETLLEILNYIQIETRRNALVSYSRIGNQFSISKVTTQRRIESLVEKGLIFSKKQGRNKTLHITDKGKNLLAHRSII